MKGVPTWNVKKKPLMMAAQVAQLFPSRDVHSDSVLVYEHQRRTFVAGWRPTSGLWRQRDDPKAFGDKYPPVSTVTFFRGDLSAVQSSLPKKVASIVVANKWLDGVMHRSGKKLMLRVPDRVVDANARHYVEAPRQPAVGAELANDPVALERLLSPYFVAKGVDADMVSAVGLAGSRRIVDDPESSSNYQNRRVEVHCA